MMREKNVLRDKSDSLGSIGRPSNAKVAKFAMLVEKPDRLNRSRQHTVFCHDDIATDSTLILAAVSKVLRLPFCESTIITR